MIRRSPSPAPSARLAHGFTLLEAIVALVVFSMGAFALYGWLSTNVMALERIAERRERAEARLSALDLVRRVNPMAESEGVREVGGLRVRWKSTLVEPAKPGATQAGMPTLFRIGLYRLDLGVYRNGKLVDEFAVRQVGYEQVGTLGFD